MTKHRWTSGKASGWIVLAALLASGCAARSGARTTYHDTSMDFSLVRKVAVMPFRNLTTQSAAAERVRDVFVTALQSEGWLYVLPPGEVSRALERVPIKNPTEPSAEEIVPFAKNLEVDAVFTATLLEYGELRSGGATSNHISISAKMIEAATGKVVWSAVVSKGGVSGVDRLFGGGGRPMNDVTLEAVRELVKLLTEE